MNLTKTRSILTRKGDRYEDVRFLSDAEDGERPRHVLFMDRGLWHEMGAPATVTITVEPGDHLNSED